jgi:uncharacterized protein (TIGR02453 family)
MPSTAPVFPRAGLELLAELRENNSTDWFHAHRNEYRTLVQAPMLAITEFVNGELRRFAPAYVNAKKSPLSRPNRDTRFSNDKSPYRTDVSVVFPRGGAEKHQCAGFFFSVSPEGAELIAGAYMPGPDELRVLREHLAERHAAFHRVAEGAALRKEWSALQGDQLKRVPRGFDVDHPAGSLLRRTQFYVRRTMTPRAVTTFGFAEGLAASFRVATPFVNALDAVLGADSTA